MSYYPIELDKMRNFKYGMKALHLIEKKLKKPVSKINMDNLTMEDAATLIWAGLQHEDKDLTPEKVMDLVDEYSSLPAVMQAMGEAFAGAFGIDKPGEKEEAKNE
jgi:UDP-N-acetylglucosamine:LPS N-acetylglucosamine transferase